MPNEITLERDRERIEECVAKWKKKKETETVAEEVSLRKIYLANYENRKTFFESEDTSI